MANKKISDLTSNPTPALTDLLEIEAPGVGSFKETANALAALYQTAFGAGGSLPLAGYGSVTSVGLTAASTWLTITGSPVTRAGSMAIRSGGAQGGASVLATSPNSTSSLSVRQLAVQHLVNAGATSTSPGAVQLAGDLGGTAVS